MADATVPAITVTATTTIPGLVPALNRLVQPLTAIPSDTGITAAIPVNDGRSFAEKRTSR